MEPTDRPARHPILDRLENTDYGDFNGQSLDYEPNLEFDDTDLKQDIEEELEQMNLSTNLLLNLRHPDEHELTTSERPGDELRASAEPYLDELYLEGGGRQVASGNHSPAYLESPHDLLEENFEEAFKSSLFELDNNLVTANHKLGRPHRFRLLAGGRASASVLRQQQQHKPARPRQGQHGKLNAFFSKATSGFYTPSSSSSSSSTTSNKLQQRDNNHSPTCTLDSSTGQPGEQTGRHLCAPVSPMDELRFDPNYELDELYDYDEDDDFSDIAQHNCVEVAGDDLFGRKIITIYACRLPSETKIHHLRLLKYIMFTLDQYVENDYCVVYFHHGLNSQNKPKLNFLYQAYKAFDRKYKKNLKALFLVHPTNFIRIVWQLFKPVIR